MSQLVATLENLLLFIYKEYENNNYRSLRFDKNDKIKYN